MWEWHVPSGQLRFDARASALVESPDSHTAPSSLAAVELLMHPQDVERWQQRWRDKYGHGPRRYARAQSLSL